MSSVLLDSPTDALREQAQLIERDVDAALAVEQFLAEAQADAERERRVAQRARVFGELRDAIVALARMPEWRAHDLARELLLTLEDLRSAIEMDPDALDPEWRERE